jgi:ketosteroid isomerase-like protein
MADHPNAQIARTAMEAFSKGDFDTFVATLDDGVVWHAPGNNRFSGVREGKQAVMGRFMEQRESGFVLSFEDIHDVLGNYDHVVALLTIRFAGPDEVVTGHSVFTMHIRDGKLVEFWAMNEDQAAVDALFG